MTGEPLTYWSSGGEIVARPGQVLSNGDANRLLDHHTQAGAQALVAQLRQALDAAARWRRAATTSYAPVSFENRLTKSSRVLALSGSMSGTGTPRNSHSGSQPCEAS